MNSRIHSLPVYETRLTRMEALYFNVVRLALSRLNDPMRIRLTSLHTLDLLLDDDAWIVVDRTSNDKPVLAWLDFETRNRMSLCAAIPCRVNYYHSQSTIIVDKIKETLYYVLNTRLLNLGENGPSKIIPIR